VLIGPLVNRLRGAALRVGLVACFVFLLVPGGASAGTLDQQQLTAPGTGLFIHSTQSVAQTFTARITGGLDQADLHLGKAGAVGADLIIEIRDASSAGPGSQILAGLSVPASAVPASPDFVHVNFNPTAPVVAGHQYAIVADTSSLMGHNYIWT